MKIWAHTLVKNEEKYLWYSVASVIDYVDRLLLWDSGSTDKTINIAKEIARRYPRKVYFREVGKVDVLEFTKVRQNMLDETDADWFLVLDGDEVWWNDSIKNVTERIRKSGEELESIVVPVYNLVGDIYHYQEERAGLYHLAGQKGHLNLRAVNTKISGLHVEKPHGQMGYFDKDSKPIQERDARNMAFLDTPYMHFTYLIRSSSRQKDLLVPKRDMKLKYELGTPFAKDFYYPEVFFKPRPKIVQSPWQKMDMAFYLRALVETPPRRIKRRLFKSKVGY